MCDIAQEVKDELRKFRFAKNNESSALICKLRRAIRFCHFKSIDKLLSVKVDREKQIIVIDEHIEDVSVEELQVSSTIINFSRFDKFLCMTHAYSLIIGAVAIASATVYCIFLQNGS
jgi:hypothetical protein